MRIRLVIKSGLGLSDFDQGEVKAEPVARRPGLRL